MNTINDLTRRSLLFGSVAGITLLSGGAGAQSAKRPPNIVFFLADDLGFAEAAMLEALHAGRIVAALDVYDREPLPPDHALRSAPNTVLSPHLGYCVKETWDGFYPQMIENALAFMDGKPVRVTNPEVLTR